MPYKVKYEKRRGYLYILMEGPESHQAAVQFWENLSKKSEAEDISYFLVVDKVLGTLTKVQLLAVSEVVAKLFSGKTIAELENRYKNKGYAEFKKDLAEVIIKELADFQKKRKELEKNPEQVEKILADGAKKAQKNAEQNMKEIKTKMGLL